MQTATAERLYHEHAAKMPIIDYHCHLNPEYVASDHGFDNLSKIWLEGDHYKWRAMRANGVDERYCTGDASDWEKFEKWAETVPYTMRNPLYHWTHLELKTAFGVTELLNPTTARPIYDRCSEKLRKPEYHARGLMRHYNVEVVCTTDDPVDSLEHHIAVRNDGFGVRMLPAWRPDKAMAVESPADFRAYVERLSDVSGVTISTFTDMMEALRVRHRFFESVGCRLSDHGIEEFYAEEYTQPEIDAIFNKVYGGRSGPGKIQFGSGWWFSDQKDGMEKQMNALSTLGLLSRFVGMLTDSRSFLSYPRHEYFRRTLCNLIGNDIENGLLPASETDFIGREIVEGICYRNAKNYFNF